MATAIVFTFQTVSGAYFVTAAQSIFENLLVNAVRQRAPDVDVSTVLAAGASQLSQYFQGADLDAIIQSYAIGIKGVFIFAVACAVMTTLWTFPIPYKKLPAYDDGEKTDIKSIEMAEQSAKSV